MYSLILSQNYPERHNNGIFLSNIVQITLYFFILGQNNTLSKQKIIFSAINQNFEPQYFTLRTFKKHGNLSL